ncbi:cofilin/tropomyosin-type actin-binding protein [Aureococcus anophagefferens]|nr:cofilin/tropomyosin-type actin-binding protein [Aureococcus anophagefferens]
MAASDKRGLVENVKTLRRRLSLFGRTAFGKRVPPEVVDGEMEARRAEFADMLGGVDELGAGLAEHVAVLRAYFSNSEALAEVVASYWGGGDLDRRGAWAATGLAAGGGLVAAAAGYVGEACDALPAGAVAKARGARDCVKVGGPAIAPEQRSAAGRALAVLTGKRELADLKREAADLEDRRRLQADQARRSWETEAGCPSSRRGASSRRAASKTRRGRAGPGAGFRVVALFDCAADEDGELALAKGDVVTVTDASDAGWWKGTTDDGASGVFPSNYVAPLERAPAKSVRLSRGPSGAPPTPPDAPNRVVVALFDCVGGDDGVSFAAGALITVVDASDDGWWTGDADGKRGVFPANYVKAAA